MIWVTLILGAISLFLQWIMNRKKLTPKQMARINHVIAKFEEAKSYAVKLGCLPQGKLDPKVEKEKHDDDS